MPEIASNVAGRCFFPTNPDLADILGDMDFDFDNFIFYILGIPYFQVPGFPDSRLSSSYIWLGW